MYKDPVHPASSASRAYRWAALLVVFVLVFTAAWAQPASAGSGADLAEAPAPSIPSIPISNSSFRSYNLAVPRLADGPAVQPPVPNQGGTCITGYLIDSYHQPLGAGWEVTLTPQTGAAMTTTTNGEGRFEFKGLPGGTYVVKLTLVEGWRPFTPIEFPVTLSGVGDGCAVVRFKLEALPCIKVVKFDAGGEVNGELAGIPGWKFTAKSGNANLQATTNGQGIAFFYNLTPGVWTVTEEEKTGWRPADGYSPTQEVTLEAPKTPGSCRELHFVNQQVHDACIIVQKFDVAGTPVEGWWVRVTRNDGTQPPAEDTTDETGQVIFDHLALGEWTIEEEVREWWRPVGPTVVAVELQRPGFCQVIKFINEPLGCVDGYKINDLEQGLPGWTIKARNTDTGQQVSIVTDANGYFAFKNLSLGEWVLTEDMQPGWEPVTPPEFTVQVKTPFQCETVRFKNRTKYACLDVYKKDEVDGAGLPGWQITLQPAYGGEVKTGITDGTGWVRFNELTPGMYIVKETVVPGWTASSPSEYTVELKASGSCSTTNFVNIQTHMIQDDPPKKPKDKAPPKNCPMYYTVKPGDTVWGISMWFGVPMNAIVRVNHLNNPSVIYTGTRLCIPLGDP